MAHGEPFLITKTANPKNLFLFALFLSYRDSKVVATFRNNETIFVNPLVSGQGLLYILNACCSDTQYPF